MKDTVVISALAITNWFCKKAESCNQQLAEPKIQHLLFLAQIHYALKSGKFLMPSLFICSRSGFYEAIIREILSFGLPLMKTPRFTSEINDFLELIWQKYASQSEAELNHFVLSLECWKHFYRPEEETIVNPVLFADSFADSIQKTPNAKMEKSKILISQNGPVKVSAWKPRKLNPSQ